MRFHSPGLLAIGWSVTTCLAKCTLKRQKSMSSQALSISACWAVLLWPSMVAALIRWRHGPASRSAAFKMTAQRASRGIRRQSGAASPAAATAALASWAVALRMVPSTCWWSCGCTTGISAPPPARTSPPMWGDRSLWVASSRSSSASRASRSPVPGA